VRSSAADRTARRFMTHLRSGEAAIIRPSARTRQAGGGCRARLASCLRTGIGTYLQCWPWRRRARAPFARHSAVLVVSPSPSRLCCSPPPISRCTWPALCLLEHPCRPSTSVRANSRRLRSPLRRRSRTICALPPGQSVCGHKHWAAHTWILGSVQHPVGDRPPTLTFRYGSRPDGWHLSLIPANCGQKGWVLRLGESFPFFNQYRRKLRDA
jgi:hypothetical protein